METGLDLQDLAEDIRYYGGWLRDEAKKRIGHFIHKLQLLMR